MLTMIYQEDQVSVLEKEEKIENFIVQKRRIDPDKKLNKETQNLSSHDLDVVLHRIKDDPRYSCSIEY